MMTRMDRAEAHLDEITAGAIRAVARTLDSAGTLNDLIREAAERAVRAHLQGAAQAALVDALEGDFGKAPEEQVEQALTEPLSGSDPDQGERPLLLATARRGLGPRRAVPH